MSGPGVAPELENKLARNGEDIICNHKIFTKIENELAVAWE